MVRVNVMKPTGVDVITSAEDDVSIDIRPTIGVKITQKNLKDYVFELTTRETLNGDILIYSHKDIDIVLMQEKKKIVAFAKDMLTENVYGAESRLFEYLRRRGIIAYDSIQGGNIYGSMEAKILESKTANVLKSSLVVIAEWFREEEPIMREIEDHEEMMNDAILNPDDEHATELGEVPQEPKKGSMSPYSSNYYNPARY